MFIVGDVYPGSFNNLESFMSPGSPIDPEWPWSSRAATLVTAILTRCVGPKWGFPCLMAFCT